MSFYLNVAMHIERKLNIPTHYMKLLVRYGRHINQGVFFSVATCVFILWMILSKENYDIRTVLPFEDQSIFNITERKILCPLIPPNLRDELRLISHEYLSKLKDDVKHHKQRKGGKYRPELCNSRHKVAIVVPVRNRESHVKIFLNYMHPFLQRQQLEYSIYIVEQADDLSFNRATLMNIGYMESLKENNYTCFIFHDVDLLPENDYNIYSCPRFPRHQSVAINTNNYRLYYNANFGGVIALSRTHMEQINGFSNRYYGWGGEDDDTFFRIINSGLPIVRYPEHISRYTEIPHNKSEDKSPIRKSYYLNSFYWKNDGINTCKYKILKKEERSLYMYIAVKLPTPAN